MAAGGDGRGGRKLAVLFERHHRGLFRYFVSMKQEPRAIRGLGTGRFSSVCCDIEPVTMPISPFTAWMYQIARQPQASTRHRSGEAEVIGIDEFADHKADSAPGPEESAARTQDLRLLRLALDRLPSDKTRNPGVEPVSGHEV